MPIQAIQQIMLGQIMTGEAQARQTLRLAREAGYTGIELCGFMLRKVPFLVRGLTKMAGMPVGRGARLDWRALLREEGIQAVGIHEDLGTVSRAPEEIIAQARGFQARYVVISGLYRFDFSDGKNVISLAKRLNQTGEALKAGGVALLYHNHNCELTRLNTGITAYQLLLRETDPALVGFEFDSYWPAEAGANPLALMRELGARMKLYHINDRGFRAKGASLTPIRKSDSMELGTGNMELDALLAQAKQAGVAAVILESHRNWVENSPIKSFQRSGEFLRARL